jgi:hypothetical protein
MFIKNFIYHYIIYPIIFVGVYAAFTIFKLDDTPVPINDALHMVLLYYFAISVYHAFPTINSKGKQKRISIFSMISETVYYFFRISKYVRCLGAPVFIGIYHFNKLGDEGS